MNRYQGNSGKVIRVEDAQNVRAKERIVMPEQMAVIPRQNISPPRRRGSFPISNSGGLSNIFSSILGTKNTEKCQDDSLTKGILSKLSKIELDTDDLIILLIIWLLYRESHDEELLIVMAVILFT